MAAPTGKPMFFKVADITLLLEGGVAPGDLVQCQVHAVAVTPDAPDLERYVTLCGDGGATAAGSPTWSVEMTIAQAWGANDLARILWDHQGEEADLIVQAHGEGVVPAADTPAVSVRVLLVPGPYGGEAETWLEQEIVLPCTTTPELITAPPAGAMAAAATSSSSSSSSSSASA